MKNIHTHRHVLSARENVESGQLRKAEILSAEVEEGNNEYKFKLTNLSEDQFIHRITQLNWRLNEGGDEAVYEIGVEDDGNPLGLSSEELKESLCNLKRMADTVGCDMTVQQFLKGEVGITAKVLLRRTERLLVTPVHVQVAVAGPADTGKSTLIAVLSSENGLDNGKGLARTQVFRHNHEVKSGRTSSNTQHNLYFGASGNVLNSDVEGSSTGSGKGCSNRLRSRSDMELADETCRTISFIDLAGSSKYLKTTLHGIVGHSPDYFILVISARKGMEQMTSEFLGLCFALQLNLIIVVTKVDTVSSSTTTNVVDGLVKMLKRKGTDSISERLAVPIESSDQLVNLIFESTQKQHCRGDAPRDLIPTIVPIFKVSSVTGEGLNLLRSHLFQLPNHTRNWEKARAQLTQVRIIGSFEKRDEKAGADEFPLCEAGTVLKSCDPASSMGFSSWNECIASPERRGVEEKPESSRGFTDGAVNVPRVIHGPIVDRRTGEISVADVTSIASLWTETSLSPSPPPVPQSCNQPSSHESYKLSSVMLKADHQGVEVLEDKVDYNIYAKNDSYRVTCNATKKLTVAAFSFMGPETVLFGQILSGVLSQGDRLVLGPIGIEGAFHLCSVQSIRVNDVPVRSAVAGQTATMVLRRALEEFVQDTSSLSDTSGKESSVSLNSLSSGLTSCSLATVDSSDSVRISDSVSSLKDALGHGQGVSAGTSLSAGSGLVLLSPDLNPVAHWEFEAEVLIINHPGKVRVSYEPVVHFLGCCVRQSARIIDIRRIAAHSKHSTSPSTPSIDSNRASSETSESASEIALVTGDKAICRFRFLYRPEYIFLSSTSDSAMVMREGRTKGVGKVLSLGCPSFAASTTVGNVSHSRT